MRFEIFLSSALFGASALAAQLNERFVDDPMHLLRRQQFKPSTTTAEGSTCADAFGDGYVTCREGNGNQNRLCYNPKLGQTCCTNTWACPSGAFCLVTGSCCPAGQSPKDCATQNNVTISSDFVVPTSGPLDGPDSVAKKGTSSAKSKAGANSPMPTNLPVAGVAGLILGAAALL